MTAGRQINTLTQSRCTPEKYVQAVKHFFWWEIDLDPCSNEYSIVGAKIEYILPEKNWLIDSRNFNRIYVNPPYWLDKANWTSIKHWIKRCHMANSEHWSEVIALIPVATNTSHRKEYIFWQADWVCFLADTRLKFLVNGEYVEKWAPMACCIIYWGKKIERFEEIFKEYWATIKLDNLKDIEWKSPDIKNKIKLIPKNIFELA